jgi:hypothetical protein
MPSSQCLASPLQYQYVHQEYFKEVSMGNIKRIATVGLLLATTFILAACSWGPGWGRHGHNRYYDHRGVDMAPGQGTAFQQHYNGCAHY